MILTALLLLGTFNCSNATHITMLSELVADNHTWSQSYNCRYFSYALANELKERDCTFRMVTGWDGPPGKPGRKWHKWVETPDFSIEPQTGQINPIYQKSYATAWNWSHRY